MKLAEAPKNEILSDFLGRKINSFPQNQQQASLALNTCIIF